MIEPIVAEVRKYRVERTKRFHSDLALICEDLRKLEAGLGDRLVIPQPRRLQSVGGSTAGRENVLDR